MFEQTINSLPVDVAIFSAAVSDFKLDKISKNKLKPCIFWISGTLITGNKKAVRLMLATILTWSGIPPNEKNGVLIKNEEIRKDAMKKITKYWYKLNKFIPGTDIKILKEKYFKEKQHDKGILINLAWHISDEINKI